MAIYKHLAYTHHIDDDTDMILDLMISRARYSGFNEYPYFENNQCRLLTIEFDRGQPVLYTSTCSGDNLQVINRQHACNLIEAYL